MNFESKSYEKIKQLLGRGVDIVNPATVDIGAEVNVNNISAKGVKIHPGCRIYGSKTVISAGCSLGYEAPVTIEDCQLGAEVELKGGFVSKSVFLEKANMGMSAHVREGCILEEEAGGAHCVGLKQTILFPFVTLGSLINFCDCLMAGGTSRSNHSEVGSSYIHFNFTPDADKTTASLIGDVPRGVMLNQPPIFLGGQGGIVGPVRLGYGNVVAAGSILRRDYLQDNQLIVPKHSAAAEKDYMRAAYPEMIRIARNNILYLANLTALESWYAFVRKSFLERQEFGAQLYAGVMGQLDAAKKERLKRLKAMAEKAAASSVKERIRSELHERMDSIERIFADEIPVILAATDKFRETFLSDFEKRTGGGRTDYIKVIQDLPVAVSSKGIEWLNSIVDVVYGKVAQIIPSLGVPDK